MDRNDHSAEVLERDPDRTHPTVILAVLTLAGISYALLQSLVLPALPEIQHSLGASQTGATWILTAYLLSASVCTPVLGRVGDMLGKEKVLVWVLVALAVGTLISALATSLPVLIVGRVIQGAGGGIFPLAFSIIRDEFPAKRVPGAIGLVSSLLGVGGGLGIVLAGVVVDNLSFHWLFWLALIGVLASLALTIRFVPESPLTTPGRINWSSAVLMTVGLSMALIAVSQTSTWGWGDPRALGLLAAGIAVQALWVRNELRADEPLVDMGMMRVRGVWVTNLVAFLLGMGMYASFIIIPEWVELPSRTGFGFGSSVTAAGIFLLPSTVMMVLVGPLSGRLEGRFGSRTLLQAGTVSAFIAFAILSFVPASTWPIYLASGFLGLGIGLAFAALANLIVEAVRQSQTGVATGMNTVMRTLGGALGGQLAATFISGTIGDGLGSFPTQSGFELAFGMCALALLGSVVAGIGLPGRRAMSAQSSALPA